MESAKKTRKIVESSTVTKLACDRCHSRKVKCDGANPCSGCVKSNAECIFPLTPRRRGPPKGDKKGLQEKLDSANRELEALKRGVGAHYSDVVSMQRHPFASTAEILGYLGLYSMSACVFTATPAPTDINWEDFAQRKLSTNNLILYSMLANGAASAGHAQVAKQFGIIAREFAGHLFDRTDMKTAIGLTLLGFYFLGSDEIDRASYYSALSGTMLKQLKKKRSPGSYSELDHYHDHLLLINSVTHAEVIPNTDPEAQEEEFLEIETNIKKLGGEDMHPFIAALSVVGKIRAILSKASMPGVDSHSIIDIEDIESQMQIAQVRMAAALAASSFGTPDERIILANRLVSFASSLTGLAYAMIGMRDKALSLVDATLDYLKSLTIIHVDSVMALQNCTETHMRCNSPRIYEDIALMTKLSANYPITGLMLKQVLHLMTHDAAKVTDQMQAVSQHSLGESHFENIDDGLEFVSSNPLSTQTPSPGQQVVVPSPNSYEDNSFSPNVASVSSSEQPEMEEDPLFTFDIPSPQVEFHGMMSPLEEG